MGMKLRKGDTVMVIAGDDKGKTGRILSVDDVKQRVIVERVNFVKRHTKARRQGAQSGIIEKEAPINLSNLALIDPKSDKPTRVGFKLLEDGKKVRVARPSGEVLDA